MFSEECKCVLDKLKKKHIKDTETYISKGLSTFQKDRDSMKSEFFQTQGNVPQMAQEYESYSTIFRQLESKIIAEEQKRKGTQDTGEQSFQRNIVAKIVSGAVTIPFYMYYGRNGGNISAFAQKTAAGLTKNAIMHMGKGKTLKEYAHKTALSTVSDIVDIGVDIGVSSGVESIKNKWDLYKAQTAHCRREGDGCKDTETETERGGAEEAGNGQTREGGTEEEGFGGEKK
ncbi:uncharacterized protein LOC128552099 [Mercenaria mercenaria]|uniref:uncharacterized protein LOC128552099 n=1 Tax=Mercenaria mercenaria TaxID=6596 RepID=UPI00234F5145|nr:uncharacterized protein LOC128552099 [Mercenaria mercenaria]